MGHRALFLHTSPHKQYYIYLAPSLEDWLRTHHENLLKERFFIQAGKISYFSNVKSCMQDPTFKNGSYHLQDNIEICAQGKFEML